MTIQSNVKAIREDHQIIVSTAKQNAAESIHGVIADPAYTAIGYTVRATGSTFTRQRVDYSRIPSADSALCQLISLVQREQRIDANAKIGDLLICPDTGFLARGNNKGRRPYLRRAMVQLCQRLPRHPSYMGQYLCDIPPKRRSAEFAETIKINDQWSKQQVKLRLRREHLANGQMSPHVIYAATSPRYASYDPDVLARDLLAAIERIDALRNARATVSYGGVWTTVDLLSARESTAQQWVCGLSVATNDDTRGAIKLYARAHHTAAGASFALNVRLPSVKHLGDRVGTSFRRRLTKAMDLAQKAYEQWLKIWEDQESVLVAKWDEAIRRLTGHMLAGETPKAYKARTKGKKGYLSVRGVDPAVMYQAIIDAARACNATHSKAGLALAVATAAHLSPWPSAEVTGQLEQLATSIVLMSRTQFRSVTEDVKTSVDGRNAVLAAEIEDQHKTAAEWFAEAEAESDPSEAAWKRERGELMLIAADKKAEQLR